MSIGLQGSMALFFAKAGNQPVKISQRQPLDQDWVVVPDKKIKAVNDVVQDKIFSPHINEDEDHFNPNQFYRDAIGKERVLTYNGASIYTKYKEVFDDISLLEESQSQINPDEPVYEVLQDAIMEKTAHLKSAIKKDFESFLTEKLGPDRLHLIPEISYRFSQKAFTTFISEVNALTTEKYAGFFTDGSSGETCTLHIPENPAEAVRIEARISEVYQSFMPMPDEDMPFQEKQAHPVQLTGTAVYTIGLDGVTEANVGFTLKDLI